MADEEPDRPSLVREIGREFSKDECPAMAASLAYYTIFSLAPLLLIVIAAASYFWDHESVQLRVAHEMEGVVGSAGVEQINIMLKAARSENRGLWPTLTGLVVLLFGATGVMVQLQYALNKVFNVKERTGESGVWRFFAKRLLSFAMILTVAFLLLVSLVVTTMIGAFADRIAAQFDTGVANVVVIISDIAVSFGVIALLFSTIFKWLPDVALSWKDASLAGAVTAAMFLFGKIALGIYLGQQNPSVYGPAAALVLILIWVYYSGMILMLGAEFAQVWARRHGRALA